MKKNNERYKLRMYIGGLGLLLPVFLIFGFDYTNILNSLSHYYYTNVSLFFVTIIFAFAILLLSYNGYEKKPKEKFSDNQITSFAGFFAMLAVLIPTGYDGSGEPGILIPSEASFFIVHKDDLILNIVHFFSAGVFIAMLGVMSYSKFTLSDNNNDKLNSFYKICAYIIWGSIVVIGLMKGIEGLGWYKFSIPYVLIFEIVAIEAFAFAWLRKAKTIRFFS